MSTKKLSFFKRNLGTLIFCSALIAAVVLLVHSERKREDTFTKELLRDFGIAFMVAAVVGGTYELHSRILFDSERFSEFLSRIVGEFVTPEVWEQVRSQILERQMIRRNTRIHLRLLDDPDLPAGVNMLKIQICYDAYGLGSSGRRLPIVHHLDSHIKFKDLPKFTEIAVHGHHENVNVPHGKFSKEVRLDKRDGHPVTVLTGRDEATYVPGSYIVSMREITTELTIHLQELPDDLELSVNIFPDVENESLLVDREKQFKDVILLPGQVIEFRFKRKIDS